MDRRPNWQQDQKPGPRIFDDPPDHEPPGDVAPGPPEDLSPRLPAQSIPVDHPGSADSPEDIMWYREGRQAMLREVVVFLRRNVNNGRLVSVQILAAMGEETKNWEGVEDE